MKTFVSVILVVFAVTFMASCKRNKEVKDDTKKEVLSISNCNLSEHLVLSTLWFQRSAEMRAVFYQTYYFAKLALESNLSKRDTASNKIPVVVFDIDETLLDNSIFEANCIKTGEAYTGEKWKQWSDMCRAKPLPGAIDFLLFVKSKGVKAIYISNRKLGELEATMKNMKKFGFPFVDKDNFYLRTDDNSKTQRRKLVAEKYDILLYVGDNLTDFSDVYESRNQTLALDIVDANKNDFGTKYIILPNPMYGEWENAIYGYSYDLTPQQKDSLRKVNLIY